MKSSPWRLRSLACLGAGLAIAAAGGMAFEISARHLLPQAQQRAFYAQTRDVFNWHEGHLVFDQDLGFALRPNVSYVVNNREARFTVKTNSAGLRDDERSLNDPDLVLVGDSFVFGTGVEQGEMAGEIVEATTGRVVLNAGVAQYGTLQEVRLLLRHMARWHHRPSHVFVLFYQANDLLNNVRTDDLHYRPVVERNESGWYVAEANRHDYETWLSIYQGLRQPSISHYSYSAFLTVRLWRKLTAEEITGMDTFRPPREFMLEALGFIVEDLARRDPESQDRLTFVSIPSRYYYERLHYAESYDDDYRQIASLVTRQGFRCLDLAPVLEASDYFPLDGHWRPAGHRKVARVLTQAIAR